jgi:hypothetical protein
LARDRLIPDTSDFLGPGFPRSPLTEARTESAMSKPKNQNYMTTRIAVVRHHSASKQEELEGLFPVACELIQRAVSACDVDAPEDVARRFLDTFKSDAQTFLDATILISRDASKADAHRRQNKG